MSSPNALNLIAQYGNDGESSDDDVPGPRVSTKRSLKEDNSFLPVPESIKKIKGFDSNWTDQPENHDGRIRTFHHERGNWATFVYIPYESNECLSFLQQSIVELIPNIELKKIDDLHISLTKTVVLQYHWIFPFINSVKDAVCHYKSFVIMFDGLKVYCNEDKTRTFIGLKIRTGYDTLHSLVKHLDECLSEFRLPQFYEDPSFHMSIMWCLGDMENVLSSQIPLLNTKIQQMLSEQTDECLQFFVNYIHCKSGNKMFQFPLN